MARLKFMAIAALLLAEALLAAASPVRADPRIEEFSVPTHSSGPWGITTGPDGNLWFAEALGNKIGRITTGGVVTGEFTLPTAGGRPARITAGLDGNLWFTENEGNKIGRITTGGIIRESRAKSGMYPVGITAGPDGNVWFAEAGANAIGQCRVR